MDNTWNIEKAKEVLEKHKEDALYGWFRTDWFSELYPQTPSEAQKLAQEAR